MLQKYGQDHDSTYIFLAVLRACFLLENHYKKTALIEHDQTPNASREHLLHQHTIETVKELMMSSHEARQAILFGRDQSKHFIE